MATYNGVQVRFDEVQAELRQHSDLIDDTLKRLPDGSDLDRMSVFRFLKRDDFDQDTAIAKLRDTIEWRKEQDIANLSFKDIHEDFQQNPILFYQPDMKDNWDRPVATMQFAKVRRPADVTDVEPLKKMALHAWETGRRLVAKQSEEGDGTVCQMALIVDVNGTGRAQMEMELIPYFLGPIRSHFPGLVAAVFVVNYNWTLGGLWRLVKPLLPATVIDRILFVEEPLAPKYFADDKLLSMYGGTLPLPSASTTLLDEKTVLT